MMGVCTRTLMRNVWVRNPGGQTTRYNVYSTGVYVEGGGQVGGSSTQSPIFLPLPRQMFWRGVQLRGTYNSDALVNYQGCDVLVFDGCDFGDQDSTTNNGNTMGVGRAIKGSGAAGRNRHRIVSNCTGINLGPLLPGSGRTNLPSDYNQGELLLDEGNSVTFTAPVTSATATTVTFATAPSASLTTGAAPGLHLVTILSGKGTGQSRGVAGNDGNGTITVETPWRVVPDSTSFMEVGCFTDREMTVNNVFSAKADIAGSSVYSANTALSWYGGKLRPLAKNNRFIGFREGTVNAATKNRDGTVDANVFADLTGNVLSGNRWAIRPDATGAGGNGASSTNGFPASGLIASRYRNTMSGSVVQDVAYLLPRQQSDLAAFNGIIPIYGELFDNPQPAGAKQNYYLTTQDGVQVLPRAHGGLCPRRHARRRLFRCGTLSNCFPYSYTYYDEP